MKRALIITGAVVLIALIIFASVRAGGSDAEKVYAEKAQTRKIESVVNAPGEVNPKVKVNISAHIVGKIDRLYFQEGDLVRRGQKLVDLERFAYEAQFQRARAEVSNRRIEVQRAKAALATNEMAYQRAQTLRKQGVQAEELFDRARQELENARAGFASSQEGVRQAEAMLRQTQTDLSHTTIVSPIDGKVVLLNAHEGEVVVTGTMNNPGSVIAVIADLSAILVEAEVGETEVVSVKVGEPAKIRVDAVPDKEYTGRVSEIGSSAAVRGSAGGGLRYFKVKIAIENPVDRLKPGMTSQVAVITSTALNAMAVPIQCVVERVPPSKDKKKAADEEDENATKKKYVLVVKDGKVKMTEVTTGVSDATHVAITSGLKKGDDVITGPFRLLKKLKDGQAVQITREEKKTTKDEAE